MNSTKKRGRVERANGFKSPFAELLEKKDALETQLNSLEKQIYALETSYLESSTQLGDLIRGWDAASPKEKKKRKITDIDRIFSMSSSTSRKVCISIIKLVGLN